MHLLCVLIACRRFFFHNITTFLCSCNILLMLSLLLFILLWLLELEYVGDILMSQSWDGVNWFEGLVRVLGVKGVCCVYSCCATHSHWRSCHSDLKAGWWSTFSGGDEYVVVFLTRSWLIINTPNLFVVVWLRRVWFSVLRLVWKLSVEFWFWQTSQTKTHLSYKSCGMDQP